MAYELESVEEWVEKGGDTHYRIIGDIDDQDVASELACSPAGDLAFVGGGAVLEYIETGQRPYKGIAELEAKGSASEIEFVHEALEAAREQDQHWFK